MVDAIEKDSDVETTTSTYTFTSSSMTSSDSFTRLSFDATTTTSSPSENLTLLKPHRSSDSSFDPTPHHRNRPLSFRDFTLLRKIGTGDISTVYLCRLRDGGSGEYAMKVVDKEVVAAKRKLERAETEKKIMKMMDHPFLPTLYAEFDAAQFSCIVMEYCPGGDLHSLRHRLPVQRFSLAAVRFYAAEVLVALEYLHMLGIIYRDLKPENVLVRSNGHIMLSDFDLSLCSNSIPAVQSPTSPSHDDPTAQTPPSSPPQIDGPPFFSCLPNPNRLFRSKKIQTLSSNRLFVAEPVNARSFSFVGTHEYVAPEVAAGKSHGNAVDWWALGIFIYEILYGRTPFAGACNQATLLNILKKPLTFPTHAPSSALESHARDLISKLLVKDPGCRVGSKRGAGEVKTHTFFKGLNFALIRSMTPPVVPGEKASFKGRRNGEGSTVVDYF